VELRVQYVDLLRAFMKTFQKCEKTFPKLWRHAWAKPGNFYMVVSFYVYIKSGIILKVFTQKLSSARSSVTRGGEMRCTEKVVLCRGMRVTSGKVTILKDTGNLIGQ
jgi:hypothetical protein